MDSVDEMKRAKLLNSEKQVFHRSASRESEGKAAAAALDWYFAESNKEIDFNTNITVTLMARIVVFHVDVINLSKG